MEKTLAPVSGGRRGMETSCSRKVGKTCSRRGERGVNRGEGRKEGRKG